MKKRSNLVVEAKLRAMKLEDMKYDMLPLDETKEKAKIEYENRLQLKKCKRKSSISHQLLIAALLAICLIGGSFLFPVFTPTLVSSANDFVKLVSIFINDALQLDIVIEKPLESPNEGMSGAMKTQTGFSSVEAASQYFGVPLLTLGEDMKGYTLNPPMAVLGVEPFYSLRYGYNVNDSSIAISYERILDETHINFHDNANRISTTIGDAHILSQEGATQMTLLLDAFIITISTDLSVEDALSFINGLVYITQ